MNIHLVICLHCVALAGLVGMAWVFCAVVVVPLSVVRLLCRLIVFGVAPCWVVPLNPPDTRMSALVMHSGVSMDVIGCHHLPIVTVFSCCLLKLCIFYWCAGIICFSVVLKMHEIPLPLHTSVVTSFCYNIDFQRCRGVY